MGLVRYLQRPGRQHLGTAAAAPLVIGRGYSSTVVPGSSLVTGASADTTFSRFPTRPSPNSFRIASWIAYPRCGAVALMNSAVSANFSHGALTGTSTVGTLSCGTVNESPGW